MSCSDANLTENNEADCPLDCKVSDNKTRKRKRLPSARKDSFDNSPNIETITVMSATSSAPVPPKQAEEGNGAPPQPFVPDQ
jgi:hypothetical protein